MRYASASERKWTVVLDAGHGGRDPGAIGSFSQEKNIALAIALKAGQYIGENIKNANVIYTRDKDVFVDLSERAGIANRNKADLFVSIHVNWAKSKSISGTETFIMGLAKDEQNLEVAKKENAVILLENDYTTRYEGFDPKSPESYVMFTLMQNIYQEQSTNLASMIQNQYRTRISRNDRGIKQAGFVVLFMTTMPSVLTETGFITNPDEEKYLNSRQGQEYIASSIYRAVKDYIADIDRKSVIISDGNRLAANVREEEKQEAAPAKQSAEARPVPEKQPENENAEAADTGKLEFMVQLAASAVRINTGSVTFRGLTNIREINDGERYRYVSGSFSNYPSAVSHRKKIETVIPDAFVIAMKNNKIVPLQQAIELNKNKNTNK